MRPGPVRGLVRPRAERRRPVTIEEVERAIAAKMLESPSARAQGSPPGTGVPPSWSVAGLACAEQLARRGYDVTVFERDDGVGVPPRRIRIFKLEKGLIDRRVDQLQREGVELPAPASTRGST